MRNVGSFNADDTDAELHAHIRVPLFVFPHRQFLQPLTRSGRGRFLFFVIAAAYATNKKKGYAMSSVSTHKCENCHCSFYVDGVSVGFLRAKDIGKDHDAEINRLKQGGVVEGTYNHRFCSSSCAKEWEARNPGKSSRTLEDRAFRAILFAPFKLAGWLLKIGWRVTVWSGRIACKIMVNKWFWTIFTMGMSWVTWKLLDKMYNDK